MAKAFRVLVRTGEIGFVNHGGGVEDSHVGFHAGTPQAAVSSARFFPASDASKEQLAITTFLGSPPPRSFSMRSAISATMRARCSGAPSLSMRAACPLSSDHCGNSEAVPVLDAVY